MYIKDSIINFISEIKNYEPDSKFSLGIVTTSADFAESYFSFPRKIKNWGYYFHVVCATSNDATNIINEMIEYIDEYFIDVEKKKLSFSAEEIKCQNSLINFKSLYPNNFATKACLDLIDFYKPKSVFVFGHGNIAFSLVKSMNERNIILKWCPSRPSKSIKYNKLKSQFGELETLELSEDVSIFINTCSFESDFYKNLLKFSKLRIIDVAAKGSITHIDEKKVNLIDISARLVNEISFHLVGNRYKENFGRRKDNNNNYLVSGGYIGKKGDLIVDSYKNPTYIIGISDGNGGFMKRLNKIYNNT